MTAWTKRMMLRHRRAAVIALLAVLCLASGCVAPSSGPGQRLARYRPETAHRSPWLWAEDGAATATAGAGGITNAGLPTKTGIGTPPEGSSGTMTRVLKRGDKVVICLRDIPVPDEIKNEINGDGTVNLPLIGVVQLEGKTTAEAQNLIQRMYIDGRFYMKISVIVMAEADEYFVQGEVKKEGPYPLTRDLTLLQAIVTAGGYTDFAKKSKVEIIRGNDVFVYDTYRIEKRQEKDPLVKPGDLINVPRKVFL